jgi:hypothetical protein
MGRLALDGLIGIHTNLLTPALGDAEALRRVMWVGPGAALT